jgi:hypothetical protein
MSVLIRDLTNLNSHAAFRNDVQLDAYRGPDNLGLAKNFMFTSGDVKGKRSTAGLLETFVKAVADRTENRFLVRATYGQGKSHFALALANYFGKPAESPEASAVLANLEYAVKDAARVANLREFKKHHRPFLTLLLRGDTPGSLRDKVFKALEVALKDHEATKDVQPPFWFAKAESYLRNLDDRLRVKAEEFLEKHKLELSVLLDDLSPDKRRSNRYALCVELVTYLSGVRPDFGGETSLKDALDWAIDEFCGDRGPFGGVLVLFDEFSAFIKDYLANNPMGLPLQEFLNGIDPHRGKALCIAFSQHDPERFVGAQSDASSEALRKELNRFPAAQRFTQHSSLEDVLNAYFQPKPEAWARMMHAPEASDAIDEASTLAYSLFKARYATAMGWTSERFQQRVARDCFPLHPIITALLASLELEGAAGSTRNIIGFLKDDRQPLVQRLGQLALLENGKPNFIYPITLVDYFGEMLSPTVWAQYTAVRVPDLTEAQRLVLKAMVIQIAGQLESKVVRGYANLIAALTGLSPQEAQDALTLLETGSYIKHDPANKIYSFYSGGNQTLELDRKISAKLEELHKHDRVKHLLDELDVSNNTWINERLETEGQKLFQRYPVTIPWGHASDWAAQELILTRQGFSSSNLERLLRGRIVARPGEFHKARGLVVTLIARDEGDVTWFRQETRRILDEAEFVKNAPILVLRPEAASPQLADRLLKYAILIKEFTAQTKTIGQQIFDEKREQDERQLLSLLKLQREEAVIEVASDFRKPIGALPLRRDVGTRIAEHLAELYRLVYTKSPGFFYDTYKADQPNLKNAVATLIPHLLENKLKDFEAPAGGAGRVASEIIAQYLEPKWGVVARKLLRPPLEGIKVHAAWDRLERSFVADGEPVALGGVLAEFLNIPYGYDANTLTLLFCAWFGVNRSELSFTTNGKQLAIVDVIRDARGGILKPIDFLRTLGSARIRRQDKVAGNKRLQALIQRIENNEAFDPDSAQEALTELAIAAPDADKSLKPLVSASHKKLHAALQSLRDYEAEVVSTSKELEAAHRVSDLVQTLNRLLVLSAPTLVVSTLPQPAELLKSAKLLATQIAQTECERLERLERLEDYSKNQSDLEALKRSLGELGLTTTRVNAAMSALDRERALLRSASEEKRLLEQLAAIKTAESLGLAQLTSNRSEALSIPAQSETIGSRRQQKLDELDASIRSLEAWVKAVGERLDAADGIESAKALSNDIRARQNLYAETQECPKIAAALERADQLEAYFRGLELSQPTNQAQLEEAVRRIEATREQYRSILSAAQIAIADARIEELREYASDQAQKAERWLEAVRAKGDEPGQLEAALAQFDAPPAFLSVDASSRLRQLRESLQRKLESQVREQELIKEIDQQPEPSSLAQLRAVQAGLERFEGYGGAIAESLRRKRQRLNAAIEAREHQRNELFAGLGPLTRSNDIEKLRDQILKASAYFEGTEHSQPLEALARRAGEVATIFREAEQQASPHDHDEAARLQDRLRLMQADLSEAQQAELEQRIKNVQETVKRKVAEAKAWIDGLTALIADEIQEDRVRGAIKKLDDPPAFFPPSNTAQLEALRQGAARLAAYLGSASAIQRAVTPTSVQEYKERLEALDDLLRSNPELSARQQQVAQTLRDRLETELMEQREAAKRRLFAFRSQLETTNDLEDLARQISQPDEYLLPQDEAVWQQLKAAVAEKIDEDQIRGIEHRFRKIHDRAKREACLQRLQQLVIELEAV